MGQVALAPASVVVPKAPDDVRAFPKARARAYEGCAFARTNTALKLCWWMPSWVAGSGTVKPSELLAFAAIWRSHLWGKDSLKISAAEVAEITGMSKATAYRAMSNLQDRGLVSAGQEGYSALAPEGIDASDAGVSFELPAWMAVQYAELPSSALIVLCVYHNLASKGSWGFAKVSEAWICNATGIPERTVRRSVSTLAAQGLILPHLNAAGQRVGWESGAVCELHTVSPAAAVPRKVLKMAAPQPQDCLKVAESLCKMADKPTGITSEEQLISPNKELEGVAVAEGAGNGRNVSPASQHHGNEEAGAQPSPELAILLEHVPSSKQPSSALEVNDCNKQLRNLLTSGFTLEQVIGGWKLYCSQVRSRNAAPGGGVRRGWEQYLTAFRSWLRFRSAGDIEAFCSKDSRAQAAAAAECERRREAAAHAAWERQTADAVRAFEASDPHVLELNAQAEAISQQLAGRFTFHAGSESYELTMRYCALMQQSKELVDSYRASLLAG